MHSSTSKLVSPGAPSSTQEQIAISSTDIQHHRLSKVKHQLHHPIAPQADPNPSTPYFNAKLNFASNVSTLPYFGKISVPKQVELVGNLPSSASAAGAFLIRNVKELVVGEAVLAAESEVRFHVVELPKEPSKFHVASIVQAGVAEHEYAVLGGNQVQNSQVDHFCC